MLYQLSYTHRAPARITRSWPPGNLACLCAILLVLSGCPRTGVLRQDSDAISEATEALRAFEDAWLAPARVAPPTVDFAPLIGEAPGVTVTITPLRPEDADWNRWPGGTSRLFNNRAALLFAIDAESASALAWRYDATWLRLNDDPTPILAASNPDELLGPLLDAAMIQERLGATGDLVERTRAAGPFRAAYLPLRSNDGHLMGVVAFPLPDADRHVTRVELGVGLGTARGPVDLTWTLD